MHTSTIVKSAIGNHFCVQHAALRMQQRGISAHVVELVLRYGRVIYSRGLAFRVVGRKEVQRYAALGIDLSDAAGVHVLVEHDGRVVTTYRNHDLRKIRPAKRKHAMHH